jgi:preprotein translocase subunit SecF
VLVGTYTSVFIASPILIYLGVGTGRTEHEINVEPVAEPKAKPAIPAKSGTKAKAKS